jgi:hypothetical protein
MGFIANASRTFQIFDACACHPDHPQGFPSIETTLVRLLRVSVSMSKGYAKIQNLIIELVRVRKYGKFRKTGD